MSGTWGEEMRRRTKYEKQIKKEKSRERRQEEREEDDKECTIKDKMQVKIVRDERNHGNREEK